MDIFVRVPKKDNAMAENQKMEIDLGEDVAQGNYINLAIIAHSVSEFIIDFATVLPGVPKAKVKSRVILTPEHAKRLLLSLQENITRYESNVIHMHNGYTGYTDLDSKPEYLLRYHVSHMQMFLTV